MPLRIVRGFLIGTADHILGKREQAKKNFLTALALLPSYDDANSNLGLSKYETPKITIAEIR